MEQKHSNYLEDIGIKGALQTRIQTIINEYKKILPNKELQDVFVTDYFTEDGSRKYENLWLFFNDIICEAKNFNSEDNYDCVTYKPSGSTYWKITKKEYSFEETNDSSRFNIDLNINSEIKAILKSSRNNCKYLKEILLKYFIAK